MFKRGSIYIRNFADDAPTGGGDASTDETFNYPADTPWKDMKPEEQAEYWREKAQKHEKQFKAIQRDGAKSDPVVARLEKQLADLKAKTQTAEEKAVEAAREEGRNEVRAVLNKERATTALQNALNGRVPDAAALLALDVTKFIVDGSVDTEAVKAWVDDHSEEAAITPKQKRNPDNGQGNRGTGGGNGKTVAAGRDLYAERHKKQSTTS